MRIRGNCLRIFRILRDRKVYKRIIYLLKKIIIFAASVFILSLAVFYISRLAPGDPLISYYGDRAEKMTVEERAAAEEKLGLNDPISVQYVRWLDNAAHGDFGISYKYKTDAAEVISQRIGNTLILGGGSFVLIFAGSLLLGTFCAVNEDKPTDRAVCRLGTFMSCIPEFWMALMLILIFAVKLHVLPSSGAYSVGKADDIADRMRHLVLPMTVAVADHLWYYAYMVRNKLLEEFRQDYVLFARANGLSRMQIVFRHCIRNIMPSYLSIMAVSVPHIIGGTYIVENVFSYPGIGSLLYESARYKDYNLLMLLCLLTGAVVMLCSMITGIISEHIDPRLKNAEYVSEAEEVSGQ